MAGEWLGGAIGALGSLGGSALTAGLATDQAHEQRKFLRNMRKTAYQTTMKDMKKAGLNPILAYRSGPTPLGGSASIPNIPDFGSSAAQGARAGVDAVRGGKQGKHTSAMTDGARAAAARGWHDANAAELQVGLLAETMNDQREVWASNARKMTAEARLAEAKLPYAIAHEEVMDEWGSEIASARELAGVLHDWAPILGSVAGGALFGKMLGGKGGKLPKGPKGKVPNVPKGPKQPKGKWGLGKPEAIPKRVPRRGLREDEEALLNDYRGRPSPRRKYER